MTRARDIPGRILRIDDGEPDWAPLEAVLELELCGGFMWMFEVELSTGVRVHAYKHRLTRRYLYLDTEARAWGYVEGRRATRYRPMRLSAMLDAVLRPWWEGPYADPEEIVACWAAITAAQRREAADGHGG
jgi:hypothetical protein